MNSRLFSAIAPLLASALSASADTIVLKDGTKLDGRILSQDENSYVIEVQVTRSIKDEKTVPKSDVLRVEQETPDEKAFLSIAALTPVPDMLTSDQYAVRIAAVEKFLKDHPGSSKTSEAKAILKTLKGEANEVLAGGIKIGGRIIPPAEYSANALEIDARGQEGKIRELIQNSNFLAALRAFQTFDRDFKGTQSHTALLPLISQTITRYTNETKQLLAGQPQLVKDREAGLTRLQLDDRRAAQSAIAQELADAERLFKSEKEARIGWVTVQPFYKPSLDETLGFGKQELARVDAAIKQTPADSGKAYREALQKIKSATDTAARTAALSEARTAGVSAKYLAILEAAAKP